MNSMIVLGILALIVFISLVYIFRKKKIVVLGLFLLAAVAGWLAFKEYHRVNKDLASVKADIKITAAELIRDFEQNDSLANRKYMDQILEVTGNVKEVTKDEDGHYTIALGESGKLSSVRCVMDSSHQSDAANLATGSSATIRGACTGFNKDEMGLGSDVVLNRSVIVSKNN